MPRPIPWVALPAALLLFVLLVVPHRAHATLVGQTVGVSLTDGGALALSGSLLVLDPGGEITPGDGSAIGGALLPTESVDVQAQSIVLSLEEGAPGGLTGYGAGTHYTFTNVVFADVPTAIVGVQVVTTNVTNLGVVGFTASTVTVPLDTLVIGSIPGVNRGSVTIALETVVIPEPATGALSALGLVALAAARRRAAHED